MARGFAIHNSMTTHGGVIRAAQMTASQMGNLYLMAGDGHVCPKCKCWSTIIKSHDHVIFNGKSVAYAGDQLTCGARILPKQSHVVGDSGQAVMASEERCGSTGIHNEFNEFFKIVDSRGTGIPNIEYGIKLPSGEIEYGVTNSKGETHLLNTTAQAQQVEIYLPTGENK